MHDPSYLLISLGRCGTSLLQQLLNAHPALYLSDECHWLPPMLEAGLRYHRFCEVDDVSVQTISPHSGWWQGMKVLHQQLFANRSSQCWGIQFIGSINLPYLSTLLHLYPQAKVILLLRDPRDLYISLLRTGIGHRTAATDLLTAQQLIAARGHPSLTISYEQLCADPDHTISSLCTFLGVTPVDAMKAVLAEPISHAERPLLVADQDGSFQLRQGLTERWRHQLTSAELMLLNDQAKSTRALGYPTWCDNVILHSNQPLTAATLSSGLIINTASVQADEQGYHYQASMLHLGVMGVAASGKLKLTAGNESREFTHCGGDRWQYLDLREQPGHQVHRHPHQNAKPVYSLAAALQLAGQRRIWLYSDGSETAQLVAGTRLCEWANVSGIIDVNPQRQSPTGLALKALAEAAPEPDAVVFITTVRHYPSARASLEARGFRYGEDLFYVQ